MDSLRALEKKGTKIATCGTCLDFHNKREMLLIGEIGSMDQTVIIMSNADKGIKPINAVSYNLNPRYGFLSDPDDCTIQAWQMGGI